MGINWGSALAKGVSVAGAHIQAKRDAETKRKADFADKTALLDYQHENAMKLQAAEYVGKFNVAQGTRDRENALRSQISIPSFNVGGEQVPAVSFYYGGENVSASEFDEGLKTAYSRAAQHFQLIRKALGGTAEAESLLADIWKTNYAPALSSATGSLYTKYAGDNDKANKLPPSPTNILGAVVGSMPEIRELWKQQYDLSFTDEARASMVSWRKKNASFTGDPTTHGVSPTWNGSLVARVGIDSTDEFAPSIMQNESFLSATKAFLNATEDESNVDVAEARSEFISTARIEIARSNPDTNPDVIRKLSDTRVLQIASDATVLVQAARSRNESNPTLVELNPRFKKTKDLAEQRQRQQNAQNLSRAALAVASGLTGSNPPDVSKIGGQTRGVIATLLTGGVEAVGVVASLFKSDGTLSSGQEVIGNRGDTRLATQLLQELNTGSLKPEEVEQLKLIKEAINNSQSRIDGIVEGITSSAPDSDGTAMATYNLHMDKLYLAYAYSKFVQGGGGGNAVSNADFQNTMNALFGEFGNTPAQQRAILAGGMMKLHHGLQKELREMEQEQRYTFNLDDAPRNTATPLAKRIASVEYRQRSLLVGRAPQPGENFYANVNEYWKLFGIESADFSGRVAGQDDDASLNSRAGRAGAAR
jgi:hypothetical protein